MNSLGDLLTAAGQVPDISPDSLGNGRDALEAAFNTSPGAPAAVCGRKPGSWLSGVRAKALIGAAVAAAGAATAATVIAMPSSPAGPAGSSTGPSVIAPTTLTAATVLGQAAQAAGERAGWPNAQYWYSEDQYMCGGHLYTDKTWLWRHGNGVLEKTGPRNNTDSVCSSDLFTAPIIDSYKFGPYTWSQLYTLPTDPAKLKPELMADFGQGGGLTLFEDIEFVLVDTPAPPAVRAALFKVDARIPGVKVVGRYTDPLGRTGIALRLGRSTIIVDPASGAVIDDTESGSTVMYVTQRPAASEPKLAGSCAQTCPSASNSGTVPSARSDFASALGAVPEPRQSRLAVHDRS
jgi:hypothetical protein